MWQTRTSLNILPKLTHIIFFGLLCLNVGCESSGKSNSDSSKAKLEQYKQDNPWQENEYPNPEDYINKCESPREGIDPRTNQAYADEQGTLYDELFFIRSLVKTYYLWADDISDLDPYQYSDKNLYFNSLTLPEDPFSRIQGGTAIVDSLVTGTSEDYGVRWVEDRGFFVDYRVTVAYVEQDSPNYGLVERGDQVVSINGLTYGEFETQAEADEFFALLLARTQDEEVEFRLKKISGGFETVTLEKAQVRQQSVPYYSTLDDGENVVGYLLFNSHKLVSTTPLVEAVNYFIENNIDDLVLDLRYNNGGVPDIASELSYMIAGQERTSGEIFLQARYNDTIQAQIDEQIASGETAGDSLEFISTRLDDELVSTGEPLPTLDLERVVVLTTHETCSASEAIINGLKGVGVEVIQIGSTTCGKPYGAGIFQNCGTEYSIISTKGANAQGYGDYVDGFSPSNIASEDPAVNPGCFLIDDFSQALGNQEEELLESALYYLVNGTCLGNFDNLLLQPTFDDAMLRAKMNSYKSPAKIAPLLLTQ